MHIRNKMTIFSVIQDIVSKELKVIRYTSYVRSILQSFTVFSTRLSIFATLTVFAVVGNTVTARNAFVITAYYSILQRSMAIMFPMGKGEFS